LQILAGRVIFDTDGEMVDYELILPLVYLRSILQDLSTSGNGEGGSGQIREGASISQKPPTNNVERFLSLIGFDGRGKVNALGSYVHLETSKTDS